MSEPFDWAPKRHTNVLEARCDVCKEPATTNINQMNGTWVGLCAMHYSEYLLKQEELIESENV